MKPQNILVKQNRMIDKIVQIITAKLLFWLLPPVGAGFSIFSLIEFNEGNWKYGIGGAVAFVIVVIIASYVKLRLGEKQLTITADKTDSDNSIILMKMMQEETTRILKEEKEFWTRRIDEVRMQLLREHEDKIKFWVEREQKVRDEKHDAVQHCNDISLKNGTIEMQLKDRGILITEKGELIWPEKLQRSRKSDPKLTSGEF